MSPNHASPSSTTHVRCRAPEAIDGESIEEALARYQKAVVEMAQCLDDELSIRPETSLLSRVVLKILLPFAALSAALSNFYVVFESWATARFRYAEYAFGLVQLLIAITIIVLWITFRRTDRFPRARHLRNKIFEYLDARAPKRTETVTRNQIVNHWLYYAFVAGITCIIPFLFFLFRADVPNEIGLNFAIDTAGICAPGQDGIGLYRGSKTCAAINGALPGMSPAQVKAAEIRLDATTALTLYAVLLVAGILVSMVVWWRRNRIPDPNSPASDNAGLRPGQR